MLGTVVSSASSAGAEESEFARKGQIAVSAERLFGLVSSSDKQTQSAAGGDMKTTTTALHVNLLVNAPTAPATGYSFARVAGDYFIIDGLSLGAALGFASLSGSVERSSANTTQNNDLDSGTAGLIAPRVGYAYMFTPMLGIWPRGGFTYVGGGSSSADGTREASARHTALTLEVPFVIAPLAHVAFLAVPTLDLGLGGAVESTLKEPQTNTSITTHVSSTVTDIGLQASMVAYF